MIYIACPYWDDQEDIREYRRKKAIGYSTILIKKGFLVYSPLAYTERFVTDKTKEGYWIRHGIEMVGACNEMRVLCLDGWKESKGVQGEIERAKELDLKIKYIEKHVRLAFHGSRTLKNGKTRDIIELEIERHQPEVIVTHGEPGGVCRLSKSIAQGHGISLKLHHCQARWAAGKFHHRSCDVINDSDFCIFIHDGISQGTSNELALARKFKKPYSYYKLESGKLVEQIEKAESKETDEINGIDEITFDELDINMDELDFE